MLWAFPGAVWYKVGTSYLAAMMGWGPRHRGICADRGVLTGEGVFV